jgi:hypothetical protein
MPPPSTGGDSQLLISASVCIFTIDTDASRYVTRYVSFQNGDTIGEKISGSLGSQ